MPQMPSENAHKQFRNRVLLVDDDPKLLETTAGILRKDGFEVLTAGGGFEALHVLRGAVPDVLISDLNMPHMSGFELLSVVRRRFPQIAVIAVSHDYTAGVGTELIADAFLEKGTYPAFELTEKVQGLITESPVRESRQKSSSAPVWVPRSDKGFIVLTCPECLRSFSIAEPVAKIGDTVKEHCVYCESDVYFAVDRNFAERPAQKSRLETSRKAIERSREAVARSRQLRR
jgi:CheY-like chemotaxis protein